jgi:hypothetical protein
MKFELFADGIANISIAAGVVRIDSFRTSCPPLGAVRITDAATTGNSGSGVFDAGNKCLLGIMSRKIYVPPNSADPKKQGKRYRQIFRANHPRLPTEYRF